MSFIDPLPAEEEGGGAADLTAYEGETISLTATGEGQCIEVQATGDASAVNINAGPVVGGDGTITINAYGADGAVNISAPDGVVAITSNDPVTVNGDAIATEAYVDDALSGTTVVWQDHAGAALTASVTPPTLGAGSSIHARYGQDGDTVTGQVFFNFGSSGVAAGSGNYRYVLPVAPAVHTKELVIGTGVAWIGTGSSTPFIMAVIPAGANYCEFRQDGILTRVGAASPGGWTTTGQLYFNFTYEAA